MIFLGNQGTEQPELTIVDRWLAWPAVTSLTVSTSFNIIIELPGGVGFGSVPLVAVVELILIIATLTIIIISVVKKRARRTISFVLALLLPFLFSSVSNWIADCVHLELFLGSQRGHVHVTKYPGTETNGFVAYDWANGLAGDGAKFLLYDPSDEIWRSGAVDNHPADFDSGLWGDCSGNVSHLFGHYYMCRF
jgi:hypothetical protein